MKVTKGSRLKRGRSKGEHSREKVRMGLPRASFPLCVAPSALESPRRFGSEGKLRDSTCCARRGPCGHRNTCPRWRGFSGRGPKPFWPQGPVSRRTSFPRTEGRVGGGTGSRAQAVMQAKPHLHTLCSPPAAAMQPGVGDPYSRGRGFHSLSIPTAHVAGRIA